MSSCLVSGWERNDSENDSNFLRWCPSACQSAWQASSCWGLGDELFGAGLWQIAIHALGHGRVVSH